MKAMILAAGLGTRLRPLTVRKPKALVPIGNRPIIDLVIQYLRAHGVTAMVVNAHHLSDQVETHLVSGRPYGLPIEVRREPEILGTGGGIKNVEDFWDQDPFVVINGDILTDINISEAYDVHRRQGNLVTLILHDYPVFNQIQTDQTLAITDIASEPGPGRLAFTGIHVIDPGLLAHIPPGVTSNIIDCYRQLIRLGQPIRAFVSKNHYWRDIGTVPQYVRANKEAVGKDSFLIAQDAEIHSFSQLKEWAVVGSRCVLEEDSQIIRSILWEGVRIRKGAKVSDSIVTHGQDVQGQWINRVS